MIKQFFSNTCEIKAEAAIIQHKRATAMNE